MKSPYESQLQELSLSLPGPETRTKFLAVASNDTRLQLMLKEASCVGWPVAFTNDLYQYDRIQLARFPGQTMLWILREHGTHLYPLVCRNVHEARYYQEVIEYWSGEHRLNVGLIQSDRANYYVVSSSTLTQVTADEAKDALRFSR